LDHYSDAGHVNVGTGIDGTVRELAEAIRDLVHPTATIEFDTSKPDGMPRKVLDVSKLEALGWTARIALAEGLVSTYDWYRNALEEGTVRL
jgi:GDP-L-fucose synthase